MRCGAGLSRKDIHEAREIRDAEQAEPGIVRRTLDATLAKGEERDPREGQARREVEEQAQARTKTTFPGSEGLAT